MTAKPKQTSREARLSDKRVSPAEALAAELKEAAQALAAFDAEKLDAIEARIRTLTAAHLAASSGMLPMLLEKHAGLGQMIEATAANLKVLVSVLNLETRTEMR